MARIVALLFLLAALVCAEGASRSLQDTEPAHFGFPPGSWWQSSGKKHSRWNHGSYCYDPVTSDRSWTYYRMAIKLQIDYSDTWTPNTDTSNPKVSLFMGVSYGRAFDLVNGAEIGVWQAFTVSTADEDPTPGMTIGTISNLVIELGRNGDDSITIAGATSTSAGTNPAVNDDDNAVTGGIGKYLGAAGSFTYRNMAGGAAPTAIEGELKVWVPRLKDF